MVLVALLEKLGHRLHVVYNGQAALAASEQEKFDLILLDVQMPEMDGPETARWLRNRPGHNRHTPIVAVTAHVSVRDRESFLNSGMDDVLIKPIQRQELTRVLVRLFGVSSTTPAEQPQPLEKSAGLDLDSILARIEGDRGLLRDLISVYHRNWPQWAAELAAAVEHTDWPQVAFKAHRLRGLVRTFSIGQADQAMAELEAAAQAGNAANVKSLWKCARPLLESLSEELRDLSTGIA